MQGGNFVIAVAIAGGGTFDIGSSVDGGDGGACYGCATLVADGSYQTSNVELGLRNAAQER
jgi:hypothetical protein